MMARTLLLPLLLCSGLLQAQLRVDAPIVLDGAQPGHRQVVGLADAIAPQHALNVRTLRDAPYRYAEVTDGSGWTVELDPGAGALTAGTTLLLQTTVANSGALTITVNGQGPYSVSRGPGLALRAGDIVAGATVHVVFDGTEFQLISGRRRAPRACPSGSVAVNDEYCIDTGRRGAGLLDSASVVCGDLNGQLCSWGQWYAACLRATELGLTNMTGQWEWANSAANADGSARTMGYASCTHAGLGLAFGTTSYNYRCCYRR